MIFFEKKIEKKVEKMLKIAYFQRFFDDFQHFFKKNFNIFFSSFFAFLGSARTKQNFILMVKSQFPQWFCLRIRKRNMQKMTFAS